MKYRVEVTLPLIVEADSEQAAIGGAMAAIRELEHRIHSDVLASAFVYDKGAVEEWNRE